MCKFPVLELWKFKYLYFYIFLCLDLELEYYWLWPLSTSTLRYSSRNKARWAAWEPCSSKPRSYREPFSSWSAHLDFKPMWKYKRYAWWSVRAYLTFAFCVRKCVIACFCVQIPPVQFSVFIIIIFTLCNCYISFYWGNILCY